MDIHLYATILLFFRLIALTLIGAVIKRQLELFKLPIDSEISSYRKRLFYLAVVIFIGNLVPAVIDILTITNGLDRSANTVSGVSLVYTGAWVTTSTLMAYLIHSLYRMSHKVDESHEQSDHTLMNEEQ